ncbi:MAG: EamA family transporter [Nitrososphaeraceae archaeon]|nr:EamA family transporter [Nitrososphaeraceae archaeon]
MSYLLAQKSWVVFVYAFAISVESIIIEYLTTSFLKFSPIILSATSITLAGIMLLIVAAFFFKRNKRIPILFTKSWKILILASSSLSLGIFTWYDSINRIGASKEALIAGPIEIVIIVVLARIFLNERLNRFQIIGISIGLVGFFMALASDVDIVVNNNNAIKTTFTSSSSLLSIISLGDIEAILSAFGFAIGVLFLSKLILKYSSIEVAGASMFTSGLLLVGTLVLGLFFYNAVPLISSPHELSLPRQPSLIVNVIILLLFSLIPFIGSLSYSSGLGRIGASLTATIGSSSILITIVIQIMLKELGFASHLPQNIYLAFLGGVIGFLGIYLIHVPDLLISRKTK